MNLKAGNKGLVLYAVRGQMFSFHFCKASDKYEMRIYVTYINM